MTKPTSTSYFLLCSIALISSYAWFLILVPSDQPDFNYHVKDIAETGLFSKFFLWLETGIYSSCKNIEVAPIELILIHSQYYCGLSFSFVRISRVAISILLMFLILVMLREKLHIKIMVYFLCINTPGFMQVLSFHSKESIFLIISSMFLSSRSMLIKLLVFLLGFLIFDSGSAFIFLIFALFLSFWKSFVLYSRINLILFLLSYLAMVLGFGINNLKFFQYLPVLGDRLMVVHEHYSSIYAYVYDNYPPISRPILTFSGFFAFTPMAFGTVWVGFFCYVFVLGTAAFPLLNSLIYRSRFQDLRASEVLTNFTPIVLLIIGVCIVLPGYSNVKYFMFCLPLILQGLLSKHSSKNVFSYILIASAVSYSVVLYELASQNNVF